MLEVCTLVKPLQDNSGSLCMRSLRALVQKMEGIKVFAKLAFQCNLLFKKKKKKGSF